MRKKLKKIAFFFRNSDYYCIFLVCVIIKVKNKTISSFQFSLGENLGMEGTFDLNYDGTQSFIATYLTLGTLIGF